eukprot:CAMPEP_0119332604 /NCGR_PEP_ID=MMETSP1333-20130426/83162_1 /TAXON_ID=418940 /ORGANISM="Scyphosphaera apsteinii, Strain RCC1455" /LENGTH=348 /DNA_ID=CAMNT_0007342467 /DNA_START=55 /DNA_END=1097 /DNA_ORIENTATION=+
MGTTASAAAPSHVLLEQLTGKSSIAIEDQFWQQLLSFHVPVPQGRTEEDVSAISHHFCAEMVQNNVLSGNFQTLALVMVDRLKRSCKPQASSGTLQQACGCVFLARTFLKHMLETLEPEDVIPHLSGTTESASASPAPIPPVTSQASLADPILEALLEVVCDCKLDVHSYWLHMEALAALTVCLSAQLFCELSSPAPLPLVVAALGRSGPLPARVVLRLLRHYVQQPPPPAPEGLLKTISSGLGYVMHLPWQVFSFFFRSSGFAPVQLADRALQVLLLLTQHLPPVLFPDPAVNNAYLFALRSVGDMAVEAEQDGQDDPEQGKCSNLQISFRHLHDAISASLPQEGAA